MAMVQRLHSLRLSAPCWARSAAQKQSRVRWVGWVKQKVIETVRGEDDSGVPISRYGITTAGMEWLISHTDLALRRAILTEIV